MTERQINPGRSFSWALSLLGTQSPGHSISWALGLLGTQSTVHSVHLGTQSLGARSLGAQPLGARSLGARSTGHCVATPLKIAQMAKKGKKKGAKLKTKDMVKHPKLKLIFYMSRSKK